MTITETESPLVPVEATYIGMRYLNDGTLSEAWLPAGVEEAAASFFSPTKVATAPLVVGGIYKLEARVIDGTVTTAKMGKREYVRRHNDEANLSRWDAADMAAKAQARSAKQLDKLKGQHALEQDLLALRAHWHKLPWSDKTAFELTVLTFIRKRERS